MVKRILVILALCCPVACATDTPVSEASIKQLLEVAQARKLVDNMMGQMDTTMKNVMQQVTQGAPVSPQTQKLYDKAQAEVVAMMKDILAWDKLEPVYLRVYQKSLSQQEVDGMIAFYKTPAGQALITKMPLIMQKHDGGDVADDGPDGPTDPAYAAGYDRADPGRKGEEGWVGG